MIVQRRPPEYLYRYRSLRGEHRDYLRDALLSATAFFASPKEFDDPLDCRVKLAFSSDPATYQAYVEDILSRTDFSSSRRRELAEAIRANAPHANEAFQRSLEEYVRHGAERLGVLCLSEYPDDPLMWFRYAESHTGVCLQFHITEEFARDTGVPLCVAYDDCPVELPFPPTSDIFTAGVEVVLTKKTRWWSEREWRVVDLHHGRGPHDFPPHLLSGVIFGCAMPDADRDVLQRWTHDGPCRPVFCEAQLTVPKIVIRALQRGVA